MKQALCRVAGALAVAGLFALVGGCASPGGSTPPVPRQPDPLPPVKTSGIRVGSPAGTTRGFGVAEFRDIADMIADVLEGLRKNGEQGDGQIEANVRERVSALTARFPIYPEL